jgi:hypothetical protein
MFTLSLLLLACSSEPISQPDVTTWEGWVYADIPGDDTPGLEEGTITMSDLNGEATTRGEQLDDGRPAYWTLEVPPDQEVSIRIEGPEHYPTVWRGRTPGSDGYWYSGAIFAVATVTFDGFLESLSTLMDAPIGEGEGVSLYGEPLPLTPADLDAWTDATITIYDGDGNIHPAITLVQDELTGGLMLPGPEPAPIAAFVATDLAPGDIALVIDASDGRSTVMEYRSQAGDLLSAFAFTLPLEKE